MELSEVRGVVIAESEEGACTLLKSTLEATLSQEIPPVTATEIGMPLGSHNAPHIVIFCARFQDDFYDSLTNSTP